MPVFSELLTEPRAASRFAKVSEVRLCGIGLTSLPSISGTYSSLGSVVILDLSDNELRELPVALLEMERLKILDVSKNKLSGEGSLMRFDTSQWHGRHTLAEFIANQNEFGIFSPIFAWPYCP